MAIESIEQTMKHVKEDQHSEALCLNLHSRDHKFKVNNALNYYSFKHECRKKVGKQAAWSLIGIGDITLNAGDEVI